MARSHDTRIDRRAEEAAFLRAGGRSQREIARRFGTTQSNVSRWLKLAQRLGCYRLEVRHHFDQSAVSAERLRELQALEAPQSLIESLQRVRSGTGVRVRGLRVVDRVAHDSGRDFELELARFGRAAAPCVDELLRRASSVAVTWGLTVSCVVDELERNPRPPVAPPIAFFPVCAEPERFTGARQSSSMLAARLNAVFNAGRGEQWSLTRVPAFIPRRFTGKERHGIEAMMHASPSYQRIFGTRRRQPDSAEQPLIAAADALLTSIGHSAHPVGFNYEELLSAGGIAQDRLEQLVVGDIGGVLIRRPGLSRSDQRRVDTLNAMWTGLRYDDLAALAARADRGATPGVVVASCGRSRDEILHAVVTKGLVNELVLDGEAADLLLARLDQP